MVRSSYLLRAFCLWSKEQGVALVPSHPCCMTWNKSFALSASSSVWTQQRHRTSWWSEDKSSQSRKACITWFLAHGKGQTLGGPPSCWVWERGVPRHKLNFKNTKSQANWEELVILTQHCPQRIFLTDSFCVELRARYRQRAQEILVKSSVPVPLQPYLLSLSVLFLLL